MKLVVIVQESSIGGLRVLKNLLFSIKQINSKIELTCYVQPLTINMPSYEYKKETYNFLKNNGIKLKKITNWSSLGHSLNSYDFILFFWPYFVTLPTGIHKDYYFIVQDLTLFYNFGFVGYGYENEETIRQFKTFFTKKGHAICPSQYGREDLKRRFFVENEIEVIHWAAFQNEIPSSSAINESEILKKFNLYNTSYFIYPTNNSTHKNNQLCFGIVNNLNKYKKNIKCVLVGYGTKKISGNIFENSALEFGIQNIVGLGIVTDLELYVLIKNSVCLITTTFAEGACGPATDAWLFGTPTILSNISVLKEYAKFYGMKSFFASPYNSNDYSKTISYIYNSKEKLEKIIEHNKKHIQDYSWRSVAKKYISLFNKKERSPNVFDYKIALCLDYKTPLSIKKEGHGIYLMNLMTNLLKKHNILFEIWCYSFNLNNFKSDFSNLINKYPNNFCFNCELPEDNYTFSFKRKIALVVRSLYFLFFNKPQTLNKIKLMNYRESKKKLSLKNAIKQKSTANAVIIPHYALESGIFFDCNKYLIVHDLFTVILENLFKKTIPNIKKYNICLKKNLLKYSNSRAHFIVPTKYAKDNELLKFVPRVNQNNIHIINFPSLIDNVDSIKLVDLDNLKMKHKFSQHYIFMASQNRPNKNWEIILQALFLLKKQGIQINFITTGKLKDYYPTFKLAKKLNILDLIIEVDYLQKDELYTLYKNSTAVISSSIIEGLGITSQILEGLKIGNIPIIAVKSLGIQQYLEANNLSFDDIDLNWINLDDYQKLAEILIDIIKHRHKHIEKQKGILNKLNFNSWENVADKYINILSRTK